MEPDDLKLAWQTLSRRLERHDALQAHVLLEQRKQRALSSLRHWHLNEDEFVMVIEGECVLVEDAGETVMHAGDCAAFPAGNPNGHHFINRSAAVAKFLVAGTKAPQEVATYSDVDLRVEIGGGKARFTYKDGSDWEGPR